MTVVCLLCGATAAEAEPFWGCTACGVAAPLALAFPPSARTALGAVAAAKEARLAYTALPPLAIGLSPQPPTPLHAATRFGAGVSIKNETFSLTGSHKDRFHAVTSRVARLRGSRGIVASSTGNHGVSAAAHAAAVGLPAVVFCHPEAPSGLLRAIGAFGGIAAQLEPDAQREALVSLVTDGWFPATSMDPALSGAANPFGAEGYKAAAYETVEQLGSLPEAVFVPTAGGDTYYGMLKGFAELAELSGAPMPVVFAIQPTGANSLSRSLAAGRQITLDRPASLALSISDRQTGRQAMVAVARWGGRALDVTEAEIRSAIADASGLIASDATAVLLLTSSGFKWPDAMAEVFPVGAVRGRDELRRRLASIAEEPDRSGVAAPRVARARQ